MRATLLHAFLVTQYSGALLVRRPLRPRAGAVVRTAAGSVARCEEKITAALEPTSLRVAHRVDKTSVGRMERNGYRRSPTRRTTQMARTSPSFAYSARALSTASTHTEWLHTGLCAFRGTFARQTPTACHAEHPRRARLGRNPRHRQPPDAHADRGRAVN